MIKTGIVFICLEFWRPKTVLMFARRLVSKTTLKIPPGTKQKSHSVKKKVTGSCMKVLHPTTLTEKSLLINEMISPNILGEKKHCSHCGNMWPVELLSPGEEFHIQTAGVAPKMDSPHNCKLPGLKPGHGQMSEGKERNLTNKREKEVRAGGWKPSETFVFSHTFFS